MRSQFEGNSFLGIARLIKRNLLLPSWGCDILQAHWKNLPISESPSESIRPQQMDAVIFSAILANFFIRAAVASKACVLLIILHLELITQLVPAISMSCISLIPAEIFLVRRIIGHGFEIGIWICGFQWRRGIVYELQWCSRSLIPRCQLQTISFLLLILKMLYTLCHLIFATYDIQILLSNACTFIFPVCISHSPNFPILCIHALVLDQSIP